MTTDLTFNEVSLINAARCGSWTIRLRPLLRV